MCDSYNRAAEQNKGRFCHASEDLTKTNTLSQYVYMRSFIELCTKLEVSSEIFPYPGIHATEKLE